MKYYLVNGGFNWADEMDLNGWDILSEEEQEFSAADLFADLSGARLLSDEEYNTLRKFFGTHYGYTNYKYIMRHLGL